MIHSVIRIILFNFRPKAKTIKQKHNSFENLYVDSGYWDYAILKSFTNMLQLFITNTTSPITELSIVEKAPYKLQLFMNFSDKILAKPQTKVVGIFTLFYVFWFVLLVYLFTIWMSLYLVYVFLCVYLYTSQ